MKKYSALAIKSLTAIVAIAAASFTIHAIGGESTESATPEASPLTATASTTPIQAIEKIEVSATREVAETPAFNKECGEDKNENKNEKKNLITKIESLNDRVKPIKDVVGYVRSPQGFALKMVNDHVVKIPAWVGYAIDPVGSIKNKAIGEVKTRAKAVFTKGQSAAHPSSNRCTENVDSVDNIENADASAVSDETIYPQNIFNAAHIPIETNS